MDRVESLPPLPATLLLYLQNLQDEGRAPSSIRIAVSAVSSAHRVAGAGSAENPTVHEDVRSFLRGIEHERPPQRQAAAMMPGVIAAIQATARIPRKGRMETPETAEARARVDVALTLQDGGPRVSEAAALPDLGGRGALARRVGQAHHPPVKDRPQRRGRRRGRAPACVRALETIQPENPGNLDGMFQLED